MMFVGTGCGILAAVPAHSTPLGAWPEDRKASVEGGQGWDHSAAPGSTSFWHQGDIMEEGPPHAGYRGKERGGSTC